MAKQKKLLSDLRSCMHCKYFWGHNNLCVKKNGCGVMKDNRPKIPAECVGCPYYRREGYCFPCMRKLTGK